MYLSPVIHFFPQEIIVLFLLATWGIVDINVFYVQHTNSITIWTYCHFLTLLLISVLLDHNYLIYLWYFVSCQHERRFLTVVSHGTERHQHINWYMLLEIARSGETLPQESHFPSLIVWNSSLIVWALCIVRILLFHVNYLNSVLICLFVQIFICSKNLTPY